MLLKLLASRLVDILLIAVALYFLLPRLFGRSRKLQNEPRRNVTVNTKGKHKGSGKFDGAGEYVDYEEVK